MNKHLKITRTIYVPVCNERFSLHNIFKKIVENFLFKMYRVIVFLSILGGVFGQLVFNSTCGDITGIPVGPDQVCIYVVFLDA